MKVHEKDKIGTREFSAIIIITIASKLGDMTPNILFETGKNAVWMIPTISLSVIILPTFLMFSLLNKYKDKNLIEVCIAILGKTVGTLISIVLFLIAFSATIIETRSYVEIIGTFYYPQSPVIVIYSLFLLGSVALSIKGIQGISRVSWSILPYLKVSLLMLLLLISRDVIFSRVFPIFGPGVPPVLKEGIMKNSIFGELLFFSMLYPFVKKDRVYIKSITIGAVVSLIELSIFYLFYIALFDFPMIESVTYPFHEMTRYVSVGVYITNTETFYLAFWLLGALIKYSIYIYVCIQIFSSLLGIEQYKRLYPIFGLLIFYIGLQPQNPLDIRNLKESLYTISSIALPSLPIFIWVIAKFRGVYAK